MNDKMTKFEEIKKIVLDFQKRADRYFSEYCEKARGMEEKYRPEVFKREIMTQVWPYYSGNISAERDHAKTAISDICEDIRNDLKRWALKPVDPGTLQILQCMHDFGIKLSRSELSIIESSVENNLFAQKIFCEVAKNSGYLAKFPDFSTYLAALQEAESDAKLAVSAYVGKSENGQFPGADLLGKNEINGIVYGDFQFYQKMFAAEYAENHRSLSEAEELWSKARVKTSYTLTEKERTRLEKIVDETKKGDEQERKSRMKQILEAEPDIADKFSLMGVDYQNMIAGYVDTGKLD